MKKMIKYVFFKYFIKIRVFAGGGGGGAERLVSIRGRVGCSIFTPNMVWGRGRGRRRGCLNPPPTRSAMPSFESF